MSVLEDLRRLSSAEEFFVYLEVPFDQKVLDVARLHILRRMGETLARERAANPQSAAAEGASDDGEARERCRAHLEAAYADFVARSPIQERVFKVLKDAVKERPKERPRAFVPLAAIGRK